MKNSSHNQRSLREVTVMILTGIIMTLVPLCWGGVVLWTVCAALGLSLAAFLCVFFDAPAQRIFATIWFLALIGALIAASIAGFVPWTYRWLDYVCFPFSAFLGSTLAAIMLSKDRYLLPAATARSELLRSIPFWSGVALFSYFAIQDFNAWGIVIDREAFWSAQGLKGVEVGKFDLVLRPYLHWLPSGLKAPFSASDTSQAPMNAWRLMMILSAPWLLFLAMHHGLRRRRTYIMLGWIIMTVGCGYGVFGLLNQYSNGTIMGFPIPENAYTFGAFISRTHASVHLYLCAALALSLTFWHVRQANNNALTGGPYFVSAFFIVVLGFLVTQTNSVGGAMVLLMLLILTPSLAYYCGFPRSKGSRREILRITGAAILLVVIAVLVTADIKTLRDRFTQKITSYQKSKMDDRAPLRRATWALITADGWECRAWIGYGAGSFRWISPPFQALQKELHYQGRFYYRATHAHNDWLEMLSDLGIIGILPVLAALGWLCSQLFKAFRPGYPETYSLALVLILFGAHAALDLFFWFIPLTFTAVFIMAMMTTLVGRSHTSKIYKPS